MILFYFLLIFDFNEAGGPSSAYFASSSIISPFDATALNPATLNKIGYNGVGLVHTKPFSINSLTYNRLILNINRPALGFSFSSFGQTGYQENLLSLATAFSINDNISYGFIFKGYYLKISDYGTDFFPSINLGILYCQASFCLAAVLEDLNNPKSRQNDKIPVSLRIGSSLIPNNSLSLSVDFLKNIEYERFFAGVEFDLLPILSFRAGMATNPYLIGGGFGILFKHLSFDYAYQYHPKLKETHILSLGLKS